LSSLRDVLFEHTPPAPVEVSTSQNSPPAAAAADIEAARAVLRGALDAQLGPGVREFALQDEALAEALPDRALRQRAALRVLARKGTSRAALCDELEHALALLTAQGEAFARKLHERREALLASQRGVNEQCARATSAAEERILRLEAELSAERAAIAEAQTHRDQELAAAEVKLAELAARELGFQRALAEVETDYRTLKIQLSAEPA
jgi:hypothetical protein